MKHRGTYNFSVSRNVVISFANAIATILNIFIDQNTSKNSVKLRQTKQFSNCDFSFFDFGEQVKTLIKSICFAYSSKMVIFERHFVICSRFTWLYEGLYTKHYSIIFALNVGLILPRLCQCYLLFLLPPLLSHKHRLYIWILDRILQGLWSQFA